MSNLQPFCTETVRVRKPGSSIENTSAFVRENCVCNHPPAHLCICPFIHTPIHPPTHSFIYPSVHSSTIHIPSFTPPSIYQPIHLSIHSHLNQPISLLTHYSSTNPSTRPFTHPHIYLLFISPFMYLHTTPLCSNIYVFICTPIYSSVYPPIHPSAHLPTHSFIYSSVH